MKRIHFLGLALASVFCMMSCQRTETEVPQQLKNAFSYSGGEPVSIGSVVYTVGETAEEGYAFYVSPTRGLLDPEAAEMADDYIRISVSDPYGKVDFSETGNEVIYEDIQVSSSSMSSVSSASLSVDLTSSRTLSLRLDVTMASGQTLKAEYDGYCVKYPADPESFDVVLDKTIYSYYFGQSSTASDTHNYYFTFTDADFTVDSSSSSPSYELDGEGYVFILDLFTDIGDRWKDLPSGVYSEADDYTDHTYTINYSAAFHFDSEGTRTQLLLAGPLTVDTDDDGVTTISGTFYENNAKRTFAYKGKLDIKNGTVTMSLPQIGHDVTDFQGTYAEGLYNGNLFGSGTGMMQVNIQDANAAKGEAGYSAVLVLFNKLFADSAEADIIPGTYVAAKDYSIGTWMPTQEVQYMGMIIPMGVFIQYTAPDQETSYLYGSAGNINIESIWTDSGYAFRIVFDLESVDGYAMKGSYEGKIEIYDESDDQDSDDGTSSLENDIVMDLSYIPQAYMSPQTQIVVPALPNPIDVNQFGCGFQYIDIGLATGTPVGTENGQTKYAYEGDIIRMELLMPEGNQNNITPGIYTVCPERYNGYFEPFVCPPGYATSTGFLGTRYEHLYEIRGSVWVDEDGDGVQDPGEVKTDWPLGRSSVDEYACIKGGNVEISLSDKGENWYKFKFNFYCGREHSVSGTWEGPVYFSGSTNPVLPAESQKQGKARVSSVFPDAGTLAPYYLKQEKVPVKQRF